MKFNGRTPAFLIAGLVLAASPAMPQSYTISAKPGLVNYIEGSAELNGSPIPVSKAGKLVLNPGDAISTGRGHVELLLTPGAFVRLGANSELRMISPMLTQTQVELTGGEAYVEVSELLKENDIEVLDSHANSRILKPGLYRFRAGDGSSVSVVDGKIAVTLADRRVDLGKNHELALNETAKPVKFDSKEEQSDDQLYAWSKVRDQYVAAASFSSARSIANTSFGTGYADPLFGFTPYTGAGWYWNQGFNSWGWLPGSGAYFSPFGYGYFSPAVAYYAPVIYAPIAGRTSAVAVPVNPRGPALSTFPAQQRPQVLNVAGRPYSGSMPSRGTGPVASMSSAGPARSSGTMNAGAGSRSSANASSSMGHMGGGGPSAGPSARMSGSGRSR